VNDIARTISKLEQRRATIERAISALRQVEQQNPTPTTTPEAASVISKPKKRHMSAEGRQRIIEATKRYWAKKRAAKATRSSKPSTRKKAATSRKTVRKRRPARKAVSPAAPS
jgi:hypothetical protein